MRTRLHQMMIAFGILSSAIFFNGNWWEMMAFQLFQAWFVWNVFAYSRKLTMLKFPKWAANVSRNGDADSRKFLYLSSLILWVILNIVWILNSLKVAN